MLPPTAAADPLIQQPWLDAGTDLRDPDRRGVVRG
jgi:hypothetical protein